MPFPFEETEDQKETIDAVVADLQSERAMDRLVCGDVGFRQNRSGNPRAAFVAVSNNTQVVILVPTTLLAQQHYENFKDRFADWPINIGLMSRFVSGQASMVKTSSKELERRDNGYSHRDAQACCRGMLNTKTWGLLIIDEEHRFGVRQKEKLKSLRANVDILTLTATPIPRTLNMAMSGIRDLSIIATPPARRLSVKTFVTGILSRRFSRKQYSENCTARWSGVLSAQRRKNH